MATTPQRAWRAACPNCGAPVEFASAASASAVCSFCRSTLLRDGDALRRIGSVAELFDDHSPLQLGAGGSLQGLAFTLVGRLQYGYDGGTWNEWHALFDNGRSGWLSEDNGAYVVAFDTPLPEAPPQADQLRAGDRVALGGQVWSVASVVGAKLLSAQGELPAPPKLDGGFVVVDLRNALGEVGTLDFAATPPAWSIGRSVALSELALGGLRESSEKTLASRGLECPSCGTALTPTLATTQSLSCPQCRAVVDISQGAGAELQHYTQNNSGAGGLEPQIPLGRTGMLALGGASQPWQVVGFLERCTLPGGGEDDEQFFWREYLLYNRLQGFAFLVDADEGWSWVKPITGAPQLKGERATWLSDNFLKRESYSAKVTWVQGEFYWRVQRDERAFVSDYAGSGQAAAKRLSREQVGNELTWSAGAVLPASEVGAAFDLPALKAAPLRPDVLPLSSVGSGSMKTLFIIAAVIVLVVLLSRCDDDDCREMRATFGEASTEYQQCVRNRGSGGRTGGGSYGGWSSGGGGHK
ncbi:MAG: DUF4178 domain-containing protein [Rubrivivax sp.]